LNDAKLLIDLNSVTDSADIRVSIEYNVHVDKPAHLRGNLPSGRREGFFDAGNFHPEFISWLTDGDHQ
jgi:hypothetical protein